MAKKQKKKQPPKKGKVFRVSEELADYLSDMKSPTDTWDSVIRAELDFAAKPVFQWTHTGELHSTRKAAKASALKFGAQKKLDFEVLPTPVKVRII